MTSACSVPVVSDANVGRYLSSKLVPGIKLVPLLFRCFCFRLTDTIVCEYQDNEAISQRQLF